MGVFVWGVTLKKQTNALWWKTTHAFTNSPKFPWRTNQTELGVSNRGGCDTSQDQKTKSCSKENMRDKSHADKIP